MNATPEDQDAFWRHVVDHHVLSPKRVAEHRRTLRESPWIPLGKILIREGYLTVRQVMGLVAIQAAEPKIRIGDLAVREGMCTPEQIVRCLDLQRQSAPGPIEAVLRNGDLSNDRLVNAFIGYIHHLEGRVVKLDEANQQTLRAL